MESKSFGRIGTGNTVEILNACTITSLRLWTYMSEKYNVKVIRTRSYEDKVF